MKAPKLISFLACILFSCTMFAQTSDLGFSFQGYGIDPDGKALGTTNITVQFTLSKAGASFTEEHVLTTDAFGVFTAVIGNSSVAKNAEFAKLNFTDLSAANLFTLKVEVKKTTGGTYTVISNEPLKAVPYARAAANGTPVGTILIFAGDLANVPAGWLPCDGQSISKTTYSQLYTAIGDAWGTSGASFNVPDLRGMFLRGVDAGSTTDPDAATRTAANVGGNTGDLVGTIQTEETKSHNHTLNDPGHNHTNGAFNRLGVVNGQGQTSNFANDGGSRPNCFLTDVMLAKPTGITLDAVGGTETRPMNAAVHYIIKY